ncbi:MAG: R3H domain-containing nucleic acid-binding protein, partial [Desulfobacteraceae bacterium]|jgi:spoIIIJ-associated protein
VSKNRKPATLGQLNSHDRRIVHLALKEEEGVRTQSLGSGYYRKLVIYPKKENSQEAPGRQPA